MRPFRPLTHASLSALAFLVVVSPVAPTYASSARLDEQHVEAAADDCHSSFAVYLGAEPYIVNPAVANRARTEIVAVFEDTAGETWGAVPYRLEIADAATGHVVYTAAGGGTLERGASLEARFAWAGTDARGLAVPDGEYAIRLVGRKLEGERLSPEMAKRAGEIVDELAGSAPQATGSAVTVVVDRAGRYDRLFEIHEKGRGEQAVRTSLDGTFPYAFAYGTTHAHTTWSDGGMPNNTTDCKSGRHGFVGGAVPSDAYNYAKTTGGLDYLAVVEHNHLMNDACTGCSSQQVLDRYTAGFQAAQTATVPGSFVGLFGMEWGTIDTTTGHINIYNQSKLISWTGEPAHVTVGKNVYSELYTAMQNNQGSFGSYGTFNHPDPSQFTNWNRTAAGDAVMRGLSIVSGPAFSVSTSFTPGGSRYTDMFNKALSLGWKIAPETHQDNHCWNYGTSTPNRTVALIPNGTQLDQQSLMAAYGARRFFAAEDRDVQLIFRTADGSRVMGEAFAASSAVNVSVSVLDPASEGVQKIEIWGGRAGTNASPGATATIQASNTGATTLAASLSPKPSGEEWYYYVLGVQADGNMVWSAPIWITWGGSCTLPGTPSLTSPAAGATNVATSTTLSWSAVSGATSYDVSFGTSSSPAFFQSVTGTSLAVSSLANSTSYSWKVAARNACGAGTASAVRSFTTAAGGGGGATPITCGQTIGGSLATTDPRSTVRTSSYADSYTFSGIAGQQVTITQNSTAFDSWLVLKSPTGATLAQDDDGNGGQNSKIVFTLTSTGTHTIEATTYNANTTGAYTVFLNCPVAGSALISEGAESGAPGWTFVKNTGSGWSIETSTDSASGGKRFKTNVGFTTYLNNADWSLVSPAFSLTGKTSATLKYRSKYKTESGWDFIKVEVSTNGGTSWTQLSSASGQSSGYPAWAAQSSVSLTPYVGNGSVKVRFRFTSDGSAADWGVAIDDVEVTAQ